MSEVDEESTGTEAATVTAETGETAEGEEAAVSPTDFCAYFLQQLEGGTTVVPVTTKGATAFTVFQFGMQRFKISVAAVKRVRKLKENSSDKGNGADKEAEENAAKDAET